MAAECGTDSGYQGHRRRNEVTCTLCCDAHAAYERKRRAKRAADRPAPVRELMPCGTASAWRRHKRRGEQPCDPCSAAHVAESVACRSRGRAARRSA